MRKLYFTALILILSLSAFNSAISQEQQYFGKNKVQYRSFDWYYIQTEHFDIYFYQNADGLADFAAGELEKAYLEVSAELEYELEHRVPVVIYNSHNEFQQTNVIRSLIEEGVGGFTEAFKNRVVVPFDGSYEEFRHVLHHELTHAVTHDLLYGNNLGSVFSKQYFFNLPLWFAEGFAEYSSRHGWDTFSDMYMRDATINGYLYPLEIAGGFLVYKEGQSAMNYIAVKYGGKKIPEILMKGKLLLTMDKAIKSVLGKNMKDFDEEWKLAMRKEYWPEITIRTEPKDIAKPLTDHKKDNSFYNEKPEYAPSGDRLAFFSDRSSYPEILIISTIDGAIIEKLVRGAKSAEYESFHTYQSGLSWSSDGKYIAFVSKSNGYDRLNIMDIKKKKVIKKFHFKFDSISSPDFSPDGKSIVFSATQKGKEDLYLADVKSEKISRLSDDIYDDREPDYFPVGDKVVFSSDRPTVKSPNDTTFKFGTYNLFELNIRTKEITPITDTTGINTDPAVSPDGNRICFVSDRNGIYNLYIKELSDGTIYPVTDALSGCFSPTWSPDGDKIAFSGFQKAGFDIFLMNKIKPAVKDGESLKPTPFIAKDPKSIFTHFGEEEETPKEKVKPDTTQKALVDYSNYIFRAGEVEIDSTYPDLSDTASTKADTSAGKEFVYKDKNGKLIKNKYKLKFTPDFVSGTVGYDTYFGFLGQTYLTFSDIFGNHNIYILTNLGNFLDQTNIQLYYSYTALRTDYAIGLFHNKSYYVDSIYRLFSDGIYGGMVSASRPFSKFMRLDLSAMHLSISRKYQDPPFDNEKRRSFMATLSLINDTVLWGITGPVNGHRYAIHYNQSFDDVLGSNTDFRTIELDYRTYLNINRRYLFVLRFAGAASFGRDPQEFHMGGEANWIAPKIKQEDIYSIQDIYFNRLATPVRGYEYYEQTGDRYFIANIEFRYPFVDYFKMHFPLPLTIGYINGAIFYDIGSAWYEEDGFRGVRTVNGTTSLDDLRAGFGFGARVNLGIFVLKYDAAWRHNWSGVSKKPRHYFTIGAEF